MGPQADILIVTVTKFETQSVLSAFEAATGQKARTASVNDRVYHDLGQVNEMRILLTISEMGSGGIGATQQTIQKGIVAVQPHAVIMVGIAFGTNPKQQKIGDVLISKQLMLYDLQRVGADGIIHRGDRSHASPRLINYLQSADSIWRNSVKINFGLILTGEKLVDNISYRSQLQKLEPEAIGGEMEGAGLYVACHDAKVDWIVVKAICDWADGNKSRNKNHRQRLAANNAAAFILHALQHAPLRRASAPSSTIPDSGPDNARIMKKISESINDSACIKELAKIDPHQPFTVSKIPHSLDKELCEKINSTQEILCLVSVVNEKMKIWFPADQSLPRFNMPEKGSAIYLWQNALAQSSMIGIRATIAVLLCAQDYIGHPLADLGKLIEDAQLG